MRFDESFLDLVPQRGRDVGARAGAALLPAVLEGGSDGAVDDRLGVGRRMHEMVVLAATFADQSGEGAGGWEM